MAKRRIAYTWTVHYNDPLMAYAVQERIDQGIRTWMMMHPQKYSNGWMGGSDLGLLQVGMTVTGRDQWWAHRLAMEFAVALAVKAKVRLSVVADPDPATLTPHPFRGRRAREGAKYHVDPIEHAV
jgi:hypothetical protein